jgi:ectoine hydroxylase-related dioxygenase (phytanoyl-CoA dioxygenase family)
MSELGDRAAQAIAEDGCIVVPDVMTRAFVDRAKHELMLAIESDSRQYGARAARDYAMVLLCSLHGGAFLELFDNGRLMEPFNAVLGEECIVYAYTSSSMPPNGHNYSVRIHTDCPRIIPGYVTNMGATILLDDFTAENGATWFLPRSQWRADPPGEHEFYASASRLIAPAGSALFFNARIWHAGGNNVTDRWRHALTINMCRPYMKQRIDIPRAMSGMDLSGASQQTLQKLGFFSQPPASIDEYYLPPEQRSFRQPVR